MSPHAHVATFLADNSSCIINLARSNGTTGGSGDSCQFCAPHHRRGRRHVRVGLGNGPVDVDLQSGVVGAVRAREAEHTRGAVAAASARDPDLAAAQATGTSVFWTAMVVQSARGNVLDLSAAGARGAVETRVLEPQQVVAVLDATGDGHADGAGAWDVSASRP